MFFSIPGHLYISNVLANDSQNGHRYVCIVYNPILGAHVQGHDQRVDPLESPGKGTGRQCRAIGEVGRCGMMNVGCAEAG